MNYLRLSGATEDPTELVPKRIPRAGDALVINGDAIGAIPDGDNAAVVTGRVRAALWGAIACPPASRLARLSRR
jgi:hypothetical protein